MANSDIFGISEPVKEEKVEASPDKQNPLTPFGDIFPKKMTEE